jgi:hypothetical protein
MFGVLLALGGARLAIFSVPFVTWTAFGFFLTGLLAIAGGVWIAVGGQQPRSHRTPGSG